MAQGLQWLSRVVCVLALLIGGMALAQQGGLDRVVVGKGEISVPGREAVIATVDVAPGVRAGRHTHPGDEISYIIEGELELLIDGQPTRTMRAGESVVIPAGTVHDAHNARGASARLVAVYVVEKGQPLATPVQ
jgi:quercetin dioxygenase-like cupin family protein